MANVLYKSSDESIVVDVPNPPNPIYPVEGTLESEPPPSYPPVIPISYPDPPKYEYGDLIYRSPNGDIEIYCDSYTGCR